MGAVSELFDDRRVSKRNLQLKTRNRKGLLKNYGWWVEDDRDFVLMDSRLDPSLLLCNDIVIDARLRSHRLMPHQEPSSGQAYQNLDHLLQGSRYELVYLMIGSASTNHVGSRIIPMLLSDNHLVQLPESTATNVNLWGSTL